MAFYMAHNDSRPFARLAWLGLAKVAGDQKIIICDLLTAAMFYLFLIFIGCITVEEFFGPLFDFHWLYYAPLGNIPAFYYYFFNIHDDNIYYMKLLGLDFYEHWKLFINNWK